MSEVTVRALGDGRYGVKVREGSVTTDHIVTVPDGLMGQLGLQQFNEARVVEESFAFLLERESPASILADFQLGVISSYFPEFDTEIKRRLGA